MPVENPFGQAAAWQQVDLGEEEEEQPKKKKDKKKVAPSGMNQDIYGLEANLPQDEGRKKKSKQDPRMAEKESKRKRPENEEPELLQDPGIPPYMQANNEGMPGWGVNLGPRPDETPEEKEARRKLRAEMRAKFPVDKSKMTKEQLEKYEEREKRRDEKAVRQAKMDAWGMGDDKAKENLAPNTTTVYGKFFKVHHDKKAPKDSMIADLKKAAKSSAVRKNRSPDDGWELVGDRRKNVIHKEDIDLYEESSASEQELCVSEMMQECAANAMKIYEEHERERKREKRRQLKAEGRLPGQRPERGERGERGERPERPDRA